MRQKRLRRRPKGAATTAIGLPSKKACIQQAMPFFKIELKAKQELILHWYVNEAGQENLATGAMLTYSDIKEDHELIPSSSLDEIASNDIIKAFLTRLDGKSCDMFDDKGLHYHGTVNHEALIYQTKTQLSIGWDSCLSWAHMKCLGIKQPLRADIGSTCHVNTANGQTEYFIFSLFSFSNRQIAWSFTGT